jgi:hypothetical protein
MAAVVFSTDTNDDGSGTTGTVRDNAWKQAMATAINAAIGDWTAVTFSAGNFTASSGSWTVASGDVGINRYQIINKTLFWVCTLSATTVTATPATLRIAIPTGTFSSTASVCAVALLNDNGTIRQAYCVPGDGTHLYIVRADGGNFATSTDSTYVYFSAFFQLA